jgi:hypothetical protein
MRTLIPAEDALSAVSIGALSAEAEGTSSADAPSTTAEEVVVASLARAYTAVVLAPSLIMPV